MKPILFALLPSLLAVLLLEGALRGLGLPPFDTCWGAPPDGIWIEVPELGTSLRPGARIGVATVNSLGLRGPVPSEEKPPGVYRILYLGDSSCFGLGVPLENTFPAAASRALAAARPGRPIEYLIGARPGYSSYHSRILLQRLLAYHPDLVVFYVGARNDADRARYFHDAEIPERYARRRSAWHEIRTLRAGEFLWDVAWKLWFRSLLSREDQARVPPQQFRENMQAMLEATRRSGAQALVLLPPYSRKLAQHLRVLPRYQEILQQVSAATRTPTVALQPLFEGHESTRYFEDRVHPNDEGQRVIAEAIVAAVEKAALVASSDQGTRSRAPEGPALAGAASAASDRP